MNYSEFYLAFENKFRGRSESLNHKLIFYDGLLNEILYRFPKCSLLDIGSGPVSILSRCTSSHYIKLKSVDPLADFYKSILSPNISKYDINVPDQLEAEHLTENFGADSGISAMSISEMTQIPRATIIRKCKYLLKEDLVKSINIDIKILN